MAQRKIMSVEGAAFLVASAGNRSDFEDAKAFFKQDLKKALLQATSPEQKLQVYKEAVKGFLLQLQDHLGADFDPARQIKALYKECQDLSRRVLFLGLWLTLLTGATVVALLEFIK